MFTKEFERVQAALKEAFPQGGAPPRLVYKVFNPFSKDKPKPATEVRGFPLDSVKNQIKGNIACYTVILLPDIRAVPNKAVCWGVVSKSSVDWALNNKRPLTRIACMPPAQLGAVLAGEKTGNGAGSGSGSNPAPLVQPKSAAVLDFRLPTGTFQWQLNTHEFSDDIECDMTTLVQAIDTRIRNWKTCKNRGRALDDTALLALPLDKRSQLLLDTKEAVKLEVYGFRVILGIVGCADWIEYPEWKELTELFIQLELNLLRLRLRTSYATDEHLKHLYLAAGNALPNSRKTFTAEITHLEDDHKGSRVEWGRIVNWTKETSNHSNGKPYLWVPFEQALHLVRRKQVALLNGKALVDISKVGEEIVSFTRQRIEFMIALGQKNRRKGDKGIWGDKRARELISMVMRALRRFRPGGEAAMPTDVKISSVESYLKFIDERAPKCMQNMSQQHVTFEGRKALSNFAIKAGIDRRWPLEAWKKPFAAHYTRNGRNAESEWKGVENEFKWTEEKIGRGPNRRVTCDKVAAAGYCPYIQKGKNSGKAGTALTLCAKDQGLEGEEQFARFPVLRLKRTNSAAIQVKMETGADGEKKR